MSEPLDSPLERTAIIERKLDALSLSVDQRFDEVRDQFVELRQYIEFGYARLEQTMGARFEQVDGRFNRLERKIDAVIELQIRSSRGGRSARQRKKR